jgi:hypothetical protein
VRAAGARVSGGHAMTHPQTEIPQPQPALPPWPARMPPPCVCRSPSSSIA